MNRWLAVPDITKRNAYIQIAEKTGMSEFAVEKDWWVVQTLAVIYDFTDFLYNKRTGMFKGPYIQIRLPFEQVGTGCEPG